MQRRSFIGIGLGAMATALLRPARTTAAAGVEPVRSCIVLYMQGGASQLDTWDPKPGRDTGGGVRGIRTAVTGIHVAEHLPRLARNVDKLALCRSLTSTEGNHKRARYLMHTGYPPQGATQHPGLGSLVAHARERSGVGPALPRYVAIGGPGHGAGLLPAQTAPFVVVDPTRPVRNLSPPRGLGSGRFSDRIDLWRQIEQSFASEHASPRVVGHRAVVEQATGMMGTPEVRAFDLESDRSPRDDRYGQSRFGRGCLMARRLVEAGVPFVEVSQRGWDTHQDHTGRVRTLTKDLDAGMSALLEDLADRGLLSSTLIVWMGDFGRRPDINARGGRDHYPKVASVVLAGGGVPGGQVVGATDRDGFEITERPFTVPDLFHTVALKLGLDPNRTHTTPAGRPITTVDGGKPISELI